MRCFTDTANTVPALRILWQINTPCELSRRFHWADPKARRDLHPSYFQTPEKGGQQLSVKQLLQQLFPVPFTHQTNGTRNSQCTEKHLAKLSVKTANIEAQYFDKSTLKFPIHHSWMFPVRQQVSAEKKKNFSFSSWFQMRCFHWDSNSDPLKSAAACTGYKHYMDFWISVHAWEKAKP